MSLKSYLLLMAGTTLIAYLALASIVLYFDPFQSGLVVIIFFYVSIFLAALGTFSVLGFLLRHFWGDDGVIFRQVITSFRQAIWLSLIVVAAIYLKERQAFSGLAIALLIIALAVLELFFIIKKSSKHSII